jgi:predicted GNAT superfamily acetyltransferase
MKEKNAGVATADPAVAAVTVRALNTAADYAACVKLQRDTWGARYEDCVPASLLKLAARTGGVAGGAFAPDGSLVGFVYGLAGMRDGVAFHWSHMLAVAPAYRNSGLGARLKEYQQATLRGSGVEQIRWTFDPLVARNAHLNLNKLGARVVEYVPDMYGATGSELHAFGTDRFVVAWQVDAEPPAARPVSAAWRSAPLVGGMDSDGAGPVAALEPPDASVLQSRAAVRIEVPADVEALPVAVARSWRATTRAAFLAYLLHGYEVQAFYVDGGRSFYVLSASS